MITEQLRTLPLWLYILDRSVTGMPPPKSTITGIPAAWVKLWPAVTGQELPDKWLQTFANNGGTGYTIVSPNAVKSISNVNVAEFSSEN